MPIIKAGMAIINTAMPITNLLLPIIKFKTPENNLDPVLYSHEFFAVTKDF